MKKQNLLLFVLILILPFKSIFASNLLVIQISNMGRETIVFDATMENTNLIQQYALEFDINSIKSSMLSNDMIYLKDQFLLEELLNSIKRQEISSDNDDESIGQALNWDSEADRDFFTNLINEVKADLPFEMNGQTAAVIFRAE